MMPTNPLIGIRIACIFLAALFSAAVTQASIFKDDFNRPNSPIVGNGWSVLTGLGIGPFEIQSNQLRFPSQDNQHLRAVAYRHLPLNNSTTIHLKVYGGQSSIDHRRYVAYFGLSNDGTVGSGYGLSIYQGDGSYPAFIYLNDGSDTVGTVNVSFKYGGSINIIATFEKDGSVKGVLQNDDGQVCSFSFPPRSIQSVGNNFYVGLYEVKDSAIDDVSISQSETKQIMLPGNVPLELVRIPAGSFQMGSPDTERSRGLIEGPVHTVSIGYDFYIGKYELTQRQWLALMGSWPRTAPLEPTAAYGLGDNYPAYFINWSDCQNFITALNSHILSTGQGAADFRLPSASEWEYACRAGTQTRFFFGDSLSVDDGATDGPAGVLPGNRSDYMWFKFNSATPVYFKPVGTKLPNQFGLYDMSGNVWEWCQDWVHTDYDQLGRPDDGRAWETQQPGFPYREYRGGCFWRDAYLCRSASRDYDSPDTNHPLGMRLTIMADESNSEFVYDYDSLDRLNRIRPNNGIDILYSYDPAGNRSGKTVVAGVKVSSGPVNPASRGIENSATNVPCLQIDLKAGSSEDIAVSRITFTGSGTGNDSSAIAAAKLWDDGNLNGIVDAGEIQLGTGQVFSGDNGSLNFSPLGLSIAAGQTKVLLLTLDFNGTAAQFQTFHVSLADRKGVVATGATSDKSLYVLGAPVEGATFTISTDTAAPTFDGLDTTDLTDNTVALGWPAATDSSTPITYNIWMSESPFEGVVTGPPSWTTQNLTYAVPDLQYSKPYWFLVRASDPSGNQDQNVNETRVLAMPELCKLMVLKDGPGDVEQSPGCEVLEKGSSVTFNALPEVGHHFTGWTTHTGGDLGIESPRTLTLDESTTVTAHFAVNLYGLSITTEHGQVTRNPDLTEYAYGSTVALTAEPETGYHFAGWSGDVPSGQEAQNPLSLQISGALQITANFAINTYTLSISATDGTIECEPVATEYEYGSTVTLTAKPNRGLAFLRWIGDVPVENTGDNPLTITMDGEKTVSFETKDTAARHWNWFR